MQFREVVSRKYAAQSSDSKNASWGFQIPDSAALHPGYMVYGSYLPDTQ